MGDNFDNDPLDWLDDPDFNGDQGEQDDDDFSWLKPLDAGDAQEIPAVDADDAFDPLAAAFRAAKPAPQDPEADDAGSDPLPDWLNADRVAPEAEIPPTRKTGNLPEWMITDEHADLSDDDADQGKQSSAESDLPDWMRTSETSKTISSADAEDDDGIAPWLRDADDLGAEEANAFQASFDDMAFEFDAELEDANADLDLDALLLEGASSGDDADDLLSEMLSSSAPLEDDLLAGLLDNDDQADAVPDFDMLFDEASGDTPLGAVLENYGVDLNDIPPAEAEITGSAVAPRREVIDDFLSGLDESDWLTEDEGLPADSAPLDLDVLLRKPGYFDQLVEVADQVQPERPSFLDDVTVSEFSVAAVLRQQKDRPLEDLPAELQALRGETLGLSADVPAPIPFTPSTRPTESGATNLTDSQRRRADLLRTIAATEVAPEQVAAGVLERDARRALGRRRLSIGRLLIALITAVAVILPLLSIGAPLRIGTLPDSVFAAGSRGAAAFDTIDTLPSGSTVLVAIEYGAGSSAELDSITRPILRHLFARGIVPVIVGSDPVSLLHVGRLADTLAGPERRRNQDYVVGRLLFGEAVAVRALSQDLATTLATDVDGQPTGLAISQLSDLDAVIVLTDRVDGARLWAEQVAPLTDAPLVFGSTQGAGPLTLLYADSTGGRALIGLHDGLVYAAQMNVLLPEGVFVTFAPTNTPTATPTETLTETATVTPSPTFTPSPTTPPSETPEPDVTSATQASVPLVVTAEPSPTLTPTVTQTTPPTATPTEEPSATPSATATDVPPTPTVQARASATPASVLPSATTPPSATPSPTATATMTSSPTATAATSTPAPVTAVVIASTRINIRSGPGTGFQAIATADPGERFVVVGFNPARTWVEVELPGDETGWISMTLVRIEGESASAGQQTVRGVGAQLGAGPMAQTIADDSTARRWGAQNFAALVIAVLIAVGSLIGLLRTLIWRRR